MSNIITFTPENALKELKIDNEDAVINALRTEKFSDPVFFYSISAHNFNFNDIDWKAFYEALLEDQEFHARLKKMLSELEPSAGEKDAPILENMLELITKGTEDNLHSEDDLSVAKTIHVSNFGGNQFSDITEFFGNGSDQFGDFLQNDSGLFVRGGGGFRLSGDFMDTGALADSEDFNDVPVSPVSINSAKPVFIPVVEPPVEAPVNPSPDSAYDFFAGLKNSILTGNLLADNGYGIDSDPEGENVSILAGSFATLQGGTITILENGDFTYIAPADYDGADSYSYVLIDDAGKTAAGDVDFHLQNVEAPVTLDFTTLTISSYGGSNNVSNLYSVEDGGDTFLVEGNTWVSAGLDYTINSNSTLDFDFLSTSQGEIHGIGFYFSSSAAESRTFKLFGTQGWGNNTYNNYAGNEGDWVHYTIDIGDFYTGAFDRIFFVNDDDADASGNSYFRNITISGGVEVGPSEFDEGLPVINFDDLTFSSFSDQDYTPTVLDVDGSRIEMYGNTWKSVDYEYTLTVNSTLQFDFMSTNEGELQGIGLDDDNKHATDQFIQIYGYHTYGQDGPDYTDIGSFQSFSLRLADYYEVGETFSSLTFIADDDAGADAESIFDNVTIVELGTSDADVLYGNADDQVFSGLDGDDLIYAGAGDDILYGGGGIDFLYGEGGADTFVFESDSAFDAIDRIMDFDAAEGDSLDIADILSGYDPLGDAISDFVQVTSDGQHTQIAVDADGGGDDYEVIATLYGIVGSGNAQALEDDGTLITV